MKFLILLLFTLVLISCAEKYEFGDKDLINGLSETRWTDLKENTDNYDNDTILISGRFHTGFEDFSINKSSDGIWLNSFDPLSINQEVEEKINNRDVKLFGLFNPNKRGHLGRYLGTIEEVYYLKTE